ncbi:hypothetical protein [Agrobacterium vitis]|uniref:hypothetical protein n=1 Tax=Agrobacterium vitis TaxID=373 RepID=UPI0018D260F4|nr:hypothetical protein [Agrobacterium vitis]
MRKETKPFIVEIKPSRKPKSGLKKTSIWGKIDLRTVDNLAVATTPKQDPAALEESGRP